MTSARPFWLGSLFGVAITLIALFAVDPLLKWHAQLTLPPATTPTRINIKLDEHDPALGQPTALLTLVEFNDYQCPYCQVFQRETFPKLKTEYIDTGKVRLIHKDLPLDFHAQALPAARAAHCAGEAGRFWDMHAALFARANCLVCEGPEGIARASGLWTPALAACLRSDRHTAGIAADLALAKSLAITGTPTFVLGLSSTEGVTEGALLVGALPWAELKQKLDALLAIHP